MMTELRELPILLTAEDAAALLRTTRKAIDINLTPAAVESTIRLMEIPGILASRGDMLETGATETANSSR